MLRKIAALTGLLVSCAGAAHAEEEKPVWKAPFGGTFTAGATFATDYSYRGISQTQRQVAFQPTITYETPTVSESLLLSAYVGAWASNVYFPGTSTVAEVDIIAGVRAKAMNEKLTFDLGYIRYLYPYYPASSGIEYGEVALRVDYDFGPLTVSGRVRWSPDTVFEAGQSWNKRALVTVPLTFVPLPDGMQMKIYGSLGNVWVEKPAILGLPGNDWWYWQIGLVTSVWGLDVMLAYTDTNIEVAGCGYTQACAGRIFASITKVF